MAPLDPNALTLRRFNANDDQELLDDITALLHAAYRPLLEDGLKYVATHQSSDITRDRLAKGESYLGFLAGELIATITLETDIAEKNCGWFQRKDVYKFAQFAVHPDLKGQGIGSLIMDKIEARAGELGAAELALDTSEQAHQLIAMYTKRGYREVDRLNWEMTNYKSVVLSKNLMDGRA